MSLHLTPEVAAYNQWMAFSFYHFVGEDIVAGARQLRTTDLAQAMFDAPVAIVSHGTEADPIFRYANAKALDLWEMDWETFTRLPSRLSAEPESGVQGDRDRSLKSVLETGFVDHYSAIRISSRGRRFEIHDTVLWNVIDRNGVRHGQAAFIRDWRYL
ncbi:MULTISPECIES: MEKHLA domain-containing protein [Asticcacaulis]|uniref:MEKHLA domain-containing protein n=1 Tax=Asticcacaulis TaxID=76890 RepID=UPI001AE819C0|nr:MULTISPECIES: MEKHLA domain-containing protein [Asticcacaulis]MBP2158852.1 hypothetical protein [Asticcacaulis solisilvae]MDR6799897.1 hypothetical protein [Asticcacaulis sp. BE141]